MKDCRIIRGSAEAHRGRQGIDYFAGISAESAGAEGLCLHLLELPAGAEAKAHLHAGHESAIYVLEGSAGLRHGPDLEHSDTLSAGDFVYIPAGMPHQPFNPTDAVVRAIVARTDPNEQESVVLL